MKLTALLEVEWLGLRISSLSEFHNPEYTLCKNRNSLNFIKLNLHSFSAWSQNWTRYFWVKSKMHSCLTCYWSSASTLLAASTSHPSVPVWSPVSLGCWLSLLADFDMLLGKQGKCGCSSSLYPRRLVLSHGYLSSWSPFTLVSSLLPYFTGNSSILKFPKTHLRIPLPTYTSIHYWSTWWVFFLLVTHQCLSSSS